MGDRDARWGQRQRRKVNGSYWFLFAAVKNFYRFRGLTQHEFNFLQFWRQNSKISFPALKSRCWQGWFLEEGTGSFWKL